MGAITKRNQGIRHLRKHITHIQLTFDFDQQCREVVTECIDKLPHHNRHLFAFMMAVNDLKDIFPAQEDIDEVLNTMAFVLAVLQEYRRINPPFPCCQKCQKKTCECTQRYKVNGEMTKK